MFTKKTQNVWKILFASVFVVFALFTATSVYAQKTPPVAPPANAVPAGAPASYPATNKPVNGDSGGFVLCGNTAGTPCTIGHLFATFIVIINYLIAMAGFVAVAAIVYAGFMMIYSQGQEQLKSAKSRFSGAVIGLVLVAAAYVLINSLFFGKFSLGVCEGNNVLTNPKAYIQNISTCKGP